MEELDVTKCKYFKEEERYKHCNAYKQLDISCRCSDNHLCPYREAYYKKYPEVFIQFGKYKYKEYKKIDEEYLAWLLKQELKPDLRKYIEDAIIEKKIEYIKQNKESIINEFIRENYKIYNPRLSSRHSSRSYSSYDNCPHWLDYGGDVFDAMQGCGLNGD